jgi:endonuclease-3
MAGTARGLSARLRKVSGLLAERYGRPDLCAHETDPVRNLVLTILSQNTTDANRDRAYDRLVKRFPSLPALAAARPPELEEAIRVGGLARAKAKSILGALARIREERGSYSLDFLRGRPLSEARAYLTSFPGVGVKTANILLLFSFGMPAFPVDTHVLRVTKRLGLVPGASTLAKAALSLEPHVRAGDHGPLHLNLIRLGREVCRPRNPLCAECPLLAVCPEGKRRTKAHATGGSGGAAAGGGAPHSRTNFTPWGTPAVGRTGGTVRPASKGMEPWRPVRSRAGSSHGEPRTESPSEAAPRYELRAAGVPPQQEERGAQPKGKGCTA